MGLISTWIGDVLGISSDERLLFCSQDQFHLIPVTDRLFAAVDDGRTASMNNNSVPEEEEARAEIPLHS